MAREYLKDSEFLNALDEMRIKKHYIKLTVLSLKTEKPIREIQGIATAGSITVNGSAAVRRTLSLTLVADEKINDLSNIDNIISINKKISVEIGLENPFNKYAKYGEIIWFPLGMYVITQASSSTTASSVTISVNGKDKMCLLDGTIGGTLPASVSFHEAYDEDKDGNVIVSNPSILTIIKEAVRHYGKEIEQNIFINDIDEKAKINVKYIGQKPIYFTDNYESLLIQDNTPDINIYTHKFIFGQDIGYMETDFTYPGELVFNAGDTVCAVLDKIVQTLGNFEYFYDLDGHFVFQEKKNYLNHYYTPITEINDTYYIKAFSDIKYYDTFANAKDAISYSNSPKYENLKNDFIVWGSQNDSSGVKKSIQYHLAIDEKPQIDLADTYMWEIKNGSGDHILYINDRENKNYLSAPEPFLIELHFSEFDEEEVFKTITSYVQDNFLNNQYIKEFILYFKIIINDYNFKYYKVLISEDELFTIEHLNQDQKVDYEKIAVILTSMMNDPETKIEEEQEFKDSDEAAKRYELIYKIKTKGGLTAQEEIEQEKQKVQQLRAMAPSLVAKAQAYVPRPPDATDSSGDVVSIAQSFLGYIENYIGTSDPNNPYWTKTQFSEWLDQFYSDDGSGPYNGLKNGYGWCDTFVDYCYSQYFVSQGYSGQEAVQLAWKATGQELGGLGAGPQYSMQYYKDVNQFYGKETAPQAGDQIFFYTGNGVGHTGIVTGYDKETGRVYTVEGNTYSDNGVVQKGNGVFEKSYSLNDGQIAGYGRPNFNVSLNSSNEKTSIGTQFFASEKLAFISNEDSAELEDWEKIFSAIQNHIPELDQSNFQKYKKQKKEKVQNQQFNSLLDIVASVYCLVSDWMTNNEDACDNILNELFGQAKKIWEVLPSSSGLKLPHDTKEAVKTRFSKKTLDKNIVLSKEEEEVIKKVEEELFFPTEEDKANDNIFAGSEVDFFSNLPKYKYTDIDKELDIQSSLILQYKTEYNSKKDIRYYGLGFYDSAKNWTWVVKEENKTVSLKELSNFLNKIFLHNSLLKINIGIFDTDLDNLIKSIISNRSSISYFKTPKENNENGYYTTGIGYYNKNGIWENVQYKILKESSSDIIQLNSLKEDILSYDIILDMPDEPIFSYEENYYYELIGLPCHEWREELYRQALLNAETAGEKGDYDDELLAFWRENFDTKNEDWQKEWENTFITKWDGYNPKILTDPGILRYWLDFIDNDELITKYSVNQIGRRTKAITKENIKQIYSLEIPDIIFLENEDNLNEKIEEFKSNGQLYCALKPEQMKYFSISSTGSTAFDYLRELLYQYITYNNSISITCVPRYYLEPNNLIYVSDQKSNIQGDFIISQFTIPLGYNGTMSISANEALIRV